MRKKGGFFLIPGALYNQGSVYTYALHLSGVKKKDWFLRCTGSFHLWNKNINFKIQLVMRAETAEELNKTKQTCIRLFYAPIHKGRNLLLIFHFKRDLICLN